MASIHVQTSVTLSNMKDVRRLAKAAELIESLAEDMPWRTEPAKAARLLRRAAKGLSPRFDK